jgi:hypothetical protein
MWLSSNKKYATDRFLEERASSGSVHQVVMHGTSAMRARKRAGQQMTKPIAGIPAKSSHNIRASKRQVLNWNPDWLKRK